MLLGILQSRREWTGAELRLRLEVSDRTLRRDIEDLRDLGYGIVARPGVGGHYRLGPGASLPPLSLAADEAVAIAIGLRAAAAWSVADVQDAAARALGKLERSLSSATRRLITDVEQALVPLGGARQDVLVDVLVGVAQAVSDHHQLRVDYIRHDGERSQRTIEPHRVVHTADRWYLVAWDVQRTSWRTLRLDRVRQAAPLPTTFVPRTIPDDQIRDFTTRSITTDPYPCRARLLMQAPADEVARHFGPTVVALTDTGDGTCILTTGARSPHEIAMYVGTSTIEFTVLSGEEVRDALVDLAQRFTRASQGLPARPGRDRPAPRPRPGPT